MDTERRPLARSAAETWRVVRSQAVDSRAVRRSVRLHWKVLEEIWGRQVDEHLEAARTLEDDDLQPLLDLAEKYRGGWNPDADD
jgi:hypothetical protein